MQDIRAVLEECLNIDFVASTLSNPRDKEGVMKIKVRPVLEKNALLFQCEAFKNNQVFHSNYCAADAVAFLAEQMGNFKQMNLETRQVSYQILVSKKGKVTINKKGKMVEGQADLAHNRKKNYILEAGSDIPFLKDLGVMTSNGEIVKAKFGKFRQINRFLEFIEDVLPVFDKEKEITIVDFGCGKSYLTFAMYYYLHELMGYHVQMIGLDLKADVIESCGALSQKYGYDKLTFLKGDIAEFEGVREVDMVVTLHACDTATDYALQKAVKWQAKAILSVPCCQHELNGQMENDILAPLFSYGLIKERMAALITDAMRAEYLKSVGYEAQILEFIDMEHTPKNILIRAVKKGKIVENRDIIRKCEEFLHIQPTLKRLLHS